MKPVDLSQPCPECGGEPYVNQTDFLPYRVHRAGCKTAALDDHARDSLQKLKAAKAPSRKLPQPEDRIPYEHSGSPEVQAVLDQLHADLTEAQRSYRKALAPWRDKHRRPPDDVTDSAYAKWAEAWNGAYDRYAAARKKVIVALQNKLDGPNRVYQKRMAKKTQQQK